MEKIMLELHLDQRFQRFLIKNPVKAFFHRCKEKTFNQGWILSLAFASEIGLSTIF